MSATKKIVLIVEDDPFLVKAYKYIFEKEGFEVWVAEDGEKAIGLIGTPPPSVVLLDIMLPGANGFSVMEAMAKNEEWDRVPVIILSNLSKPEDMARGKELGAIEYLVKANVDIEGVVERVKEFVE
jgi:DNA-binding response OmpR family regulator